MADPELDQILADEIEARLHLLAPDSDTPPGELRAALHSLRGATAMAGHLELSVLLAQTSERLRRGDPEARASVTEILGRAAARLRDGQPPLPTRWPEPPPGLVSLPLEESLRPDYVATMRDRLAQFEQALEAPGDEALDEAYRAVHGMKSVAAGAGDDVTAWFCHGLESLLHARRRGASEGARFRQEIARHGAALALLIEDPARGLELLRARAAGALAPRVAGTGATRQPSVVAAEELRVPAGALDRSLERLRAFDLLHEDLRSLAEVAQRRTGRLRELRATLLDLPRFALDASEAELLARVEEIARDVDAFALTWERGLAALRRTTVQLRTTSRELHRELSELRVTSAGILFERACRGLAEQALAENKRIEIVTEGDEVALDRPLADKALGALRQLLRNAVAHGIEPEEERERLGKPRVGRITLRARRTASLLRLEVSDDGRGVDRQELRRTAAALGMDPQRAVYDDHDLLTLLVLPGLTTREEADLLAGRGMGLDLAQQTALALGGSLTLQAQPQQGFRAWLELPVEGTLPQVIWLGVGDSVFALPTQHLQAVAPAREVHGAPAHGASAQDALARGGNPGAGELVSLATVLGLETREAPRARAELFVPGLPPIALGVDHVGEIERVLVHALPEAVQRAGPYAGAVRSADGALQLVLDARGVLLRARTLVEARKGAVS